MQPIGHQISATAPLPGVSSGTQFSPGQPKALVERPARLNALTGLRCFAALNIVFFHYSNPKWFGPFAPIVNAGYASVSFFILLSGFVLAYNYSGKARAGKLDKRRFWEARFTRLYPIYILSLLISIQVLPMEYDAHTHGMFWTGMALTPLLLQGWVPQIATFLNTPAWTMSAEAFFYFLFPWLARWKRPQHIGWHLSKMTCVWLLGLIPGTLYVLYDPDGLVHINRFSWGFWLNALKFTPLPHLASFVFGVMLAGLDEVIGRASTLRTVLGALGFGSLYLLLSHADLLPYALIHDGMLMPIFGCMVLGLAGENFLATLFGWAPLVFVGEASYCMYLLHFNMWRLVHESHLLTWLHLKQYDPWISYALMVAIAVVALHFVEKPAQKRLRSLIASLHKPQGAAAVAPVS